jgi:type I restriction enzyme R subunit
MPAPYSESDTRQQIIDQRLRLAGWNVDDPTQVVQELDIYLEDGKKPVVREPRSRYTGHQFADYGFLLRGQPVAVLEAKKTSRDAQVGQEQALQYAQLLQKKHGGAMPLVF